jgi:ABC-2 type transport system ATP-binding protein
VTAAGVFLKGIQKGFPSSSNVLDGVDLEIEPGRSFALLGPNGAGKTTLVRIITTLLLPDAGEVRVGDCNALRNPQEARSRIGCSLDSDRSFFLRLSALENLLFFAALHGFRPAKARQRAMELLEMFGLGRDYGRRAQEFSSGMKQKLSLARALLADPPILILDEPTRGLDPLASAEFRATLRSLLGDKKKTVLLVTHSIEEAIELGDAAGILLEGRLARPSSDWRANLAEQYRQIVGGSQ